MLRREIGTSYKRLCRRLSLQKPYNTPVRFASVDTRELRLWNSLTDTAEPLADDGPLKWYACGPTVYDKAHLGHARAYVCQDIMRRVLQRKFGRSVYLVMGVTDVDDKIIDRAQERGISFTELAREQETSFFRDMERLHVQPPTAITRVSEHMPEIIDYVQQILDNGYAYTSPSDASIYFSTDQLGSDYGKLAPERRSNGQAEEQVDDSSDASVDTQVKKQNRRDFALWKASKSPSEPSWDAPWGTGRPGWHIECSAMSSHVLGDTIDLHTGGIDLKFPHHNNEIAQCEAHNHRQDWCRHFVHFGHLYIRGLKMSKSLKNFISISEFLEHYSADHFRLFCLQFKYRANIHYSEDRMVDAEAIVDRIRSFFRSLQAYGSERKTRQSQLPKRLEDSDKSMTDVLLQTQEQVDEALSHDLDTARVLQSLLTLISHMNTYLLNRSDAPDEVLYTISTYVVDMLELFGLEDLYREFVHVPTLFTTLEPRTHASSSTSSQQIDAESIIQSLTRFRALVREEALKDPKSHAHILDLCDRLRDKELVESGVQIEDLAPGRSIYKLISDREKEEALEAQKIVEERANASRQKQAALDARMQIAPEKLFIESEQYLGLYSAFDEHGLPTHDANHEPLSKSQRKKLVKKQEKHAKAYERLLLEKE